MRRSTSRNSTDDGQPRSGKPADGGSTPRTSRPEGMEWTIVGTGKPYGKTALIREFWEFMKVRKKWWLGPIVLILLLLGAFIILTEGSALAPFIYAIF